ncbi:MAG: hypothetical protein RR510_06085 [Morganella sp. (in: enterobacteria)]
MKRKRSQRTCGLKDEAQCAKSFSSQEGGKVRTSAGAYISM